MDAFNQLSQDVAMSGHDQENVENHDEHTVSNTSSMDTTTSLSSNWNQKNCPLLRLPAELRNAIYMHIFTSREIRFGTAQRAIVYRDTNAELPPPLQKKKHYLALSETCRQIHFDTKMMPFELNEFGGYPERLEALFSTSLTREQVNCIRSVYIMVTIADIYVLWNETFNDSPLAKILKLVSQMQGVKRVTVDFTQKFVLRDWYLNLAHKLWRTLEQRRRRSNVAFKMTWK